MKKRLVFIVTRPILGGAQKWIAGQIELFHNEFDIYFVCASKGWIVDEVAPYVKDILIDKNLNKKISLSHLLQLNKFVRTNNIDLLVASSANAGVHARLSSLFTKKRTIYVSHGWSAVYNGSFLTQPIFIMIERLLSYLTTKILNISSNDFSIARNTIGINIDKMVLIENAIYPLGQKLKLSNGEKLKIIMVARFESPKRQDLLIEAVIGFKNIELYLVGDGPLLKDYRKKYQENSNIIFMGSSNDVYKELKECNIFALISNHEGLPLSVIEAMSIGMPLLLSNIEGCNSLVSNNGVVVENEVLSIKNGIERLLQLDLELLSLSSKEEYDKKFNLKKSINLYRILYYET